MPLTSQPSCLGTVSGTAAPHSPAAFPSWTRGGKKGEIQPEFSSWPFTQTLKGKALQQLYKESEPALSKTVHNPLWQRTQTLQVQARTHVCVGFSYSKGCLGERAINTIYLGRGKEKLLVIEFRLSTTRIKH